MSTAIQWHGKHEFELSGTERHEDTLRIKSSLDSKRETIATLTLPTLCVTFADLKFTNAIGGEQLKYPDSASYGRHYFNPPVVLTGAEIEKKTWIRGAQRVTIGPDETQVEWRLCNTLVIPRLRIQPKIKAHARVSVPNVSIEVQQPLDIRVSQLADGRHVGGLCIEKRHPDWKPPEKAHTYNLLVRVIDDATQQPMSRAAVGILHSNGHQFVETELFHSDKTGCVSSLNRPTGQIEVVMLDVDGWIAPPHGMKPLPGQPVHVVLRGRRLTAASINYTWRKRDKLNSIAALVGHPPAEILKCNNFSSQEDLHPGRKLVLPCYAGTYQMIPGDTVEQVAAKFCYELKELLKVNRVTSAGALAQLPAIRLPGWRFLYGRRGDVFRQIDDMFGIPPGWTRPVFDAYHPQREEPIQHEAIAVPDPEFVRKHKLHTEP